MRKVVSTLFSLLAVVVTQAQINLDSLYQVWQDEKQPDSTRVFSYYEYTWEGFLFSNPDTAFVLSQALLDFGEQHRYPKAKAKAYNLMAISYDLRSDYPKALKYFLLSLDVSEEIGDIHGMARAIANAGIIYSHQKDYVRSLEYYQRGLKLIEKTGNKREMANTIANIGIIYQYQGDNDKALDYFQRSLKIFEESGDKRDMANIINDIGAVYDAQGDDARSLEYSQRSLKICEELNDKQCMGLTIKNIGQSYQDQGDHTKALECFRRSLELFEEIGDKQGMAISHNHIGIIYHLQRDHTKALQYCKKSMILSQEIGELEREKLACQCLYDAYKAMGQGNQALVYMEKIQVIDDSLNTQETDRKLQQMEFANVMLQDSIAKAEEARLVELAHQEEVRKKNRTRNVLGGGGILALILAGGIYSRLRFVRRSRAILQTEKDRSDHLLLNILPADIAAELKEKGRADARDFEMVSILFTDFKGFTAASEKLSAQELVSEINACFEAFDGIIGKYSIEKIKTIGDAYMAAGGLPIPSEGSVKNTLLAALEMQDFISKRKVELDAQGKPCFEMRVGIHTGPVVAGIVGVKKFAYDIWGDTVNTASRMESSGEVGKVNISESTYMLLKDDATFIFTSRGKIEVKGKGEIEMYFAANA